MNGGIGCQHVGLGSGCRPEFKPCSHSFSLNKKLHSTLSRLSLRFLSLSGKVASLLSHKFSYIWYCLTHFQTNSGWLMLLQQPVKKPRCWLLMIALTRCINGCMLVTYCWDYSATDEHPIQGAGKSNGASIATETGISCSHLSSFSLYAVPSP